MAYMLTTRVRIRIQSGFRSINQWFDTLTKSTAQNTHITAQHTLMPLHKFLQGPAHCSAFTLSTSNNLDCSRYIVRGTVCASRTDDTPAAQVRLVVQLHTCTGGNEYSSRIPSCMVPLRTCMPGCSPWTCAEEAPLQRMHVRRTPCTAVHAIWVLFITTLASSSPQGAS